MLNDVSDWITQGPNPNFSEPSKSSIPCLTGRNINKGRVSYSDPDFVNQQEYDSLKRFQIHKGDTLITLKGKGSIGKIGYVTTSDKKAIFSRDIGVIRPNINHAYVNAYILSKYGQKLIARGETGGTGQSTLTTSYIKSIPIARISIEKEIGDLVICSERELEKHQSKYLEAEALLLKSLGLINFSPSSKNTNIKSFKDSFQTTNRLDAEYYQPKYEDYQNHIFSYSESWLPLEKVCDLKDKNYSPSDEKFYQYIELADIDKNGGITGCSKALGKDLPSRARRKINAGDVLISSIEGSLSSCAIVSKEFENSLCSTGFYVIKSDKINSETLLALFKSDLMQNILKQSCSGTILTAINKDEFLKIPLPLIDPKTQSQISSLIQESFTLKAKSEKLLELAKQAVEMAIEESEEKAIKFIKENSNF